MKLILTISAMILFLITGCESGKQPANDFLTVDITANYPKKELILQDFLDVEYIPLETNEEFITSASMQAIGKNLGNRDHTTVMHGIEKIENELKVNDNLRNSIETLKKKINPQG